jgi:hypothetical protein
MFWAILLTFIITALVAIVLFLRNHNIQKNNECQQLKAENYRLRNKLDECRDFEVNRRTKDAYRHGLYDGRETDRAYRELLKRYKDGNYDERLYHAIKEEGVRT